MKQLELKITISQTEDDLWEMTVVPIDTGNEMLMSYYRGTARQEVIKNFCKSFTDKNLRYWFMLDQ